MMHALHHSNRMWRIFLVLFALVFTADVMGISYMDVVPGTTVELNDSELEDTSEEEIEVEADEWYCLHALDKAHERLYAELHTHHGFVPRNVCAVPPTPPPELHSKVTSLFVQC